MDIVKGQPNIPPRVAVDNPDKVRNIVLSGSKKFKKWTDLVYFQEVAKPLLLYAENILDKDHLGQISVKVGSRIPIFQNLVGGNLTQFFSAKLTLLKIIVAVHCLEQENNTNDDSD